MTQNNVFIVYYLAYFQAIEYRKTAYSLAHITDCCCNYSDTDI